MGKNIELNQVHRMTGRDRRIHWTAYDSPHILDHAFKKIIALDVS